MIKRQKQKAKLFTLFLIYFVILSNSAISEDLKISLSKADSLYEEKMYTQSFEIYNNIIKKNEKVSPAMLLRMAFIKEGLGEYNNALYYLNLYYLQTFNKKVLKKMENLAEKYNLEGYNYDDAELFLNIYHKFRKEVYIAACIILTFLLGSLVFQKSKKKNFKPESSIAVLVVLVILLVLNNFFYEKPKAIIQSPQVYLMKGPSAGSDVVDVVQAGHRVEVLGSTDVWTKIDWKGEIVYIKDFNLKHIKL